MTPTLIEFHDAGPDSLGRRHYALIWADVENGRRRAQHFFAVPPVVDHRGDRIEHAKKIQNSP